jgi:putative Ig domain-containing protein
VTLEHLGASGDDSAPGIVAFAAEVALLDVDASRNAGAGVFGVLSQLTITSSTITHTTAGAPGTNVPFTDGSGVTVLIGTVSVDRSTTSDNAASGVLLIDQALLGDAVRQLAADGPSVAATVRRSTLSGNADGGVVNGGGSVTVDVSTVSGNSGGGVVNLGGSADVTNSTVTATHPFAGSEVGDQQGGLIALAAPSAPELLPAAAHRAADARALGAMLSAHRGAAARAAARLAPKAVDPGTAVVTVSGSIVADQDGLPDCFGPAVDGGYNLSSDPADSCAFSTAKHDRVKTDPKLGPLGEHGGPTSTHLPLKGSPAIDAIPTGKAGCTAGTDDQRGVARPQPTGGACDTGAVELAATAIAIHPASLPGGTVGKAYSATITATGGAYPTYTWALASGSLPDGLTFSSTGHITGTPTKAGTFTFTVGVNDPVLKTYTIVVAAPVAPAGNGSAPIAETGAHVGPLLVAGSVAVLLGLLLVLAGAGGGMPVGGRRARHRAA